MRKLMIATCLLVVAIAVLVRAYSPENTKAHAAGRVNVSYSLVVPQLTLHEPVVLNFAVENGLTQPVKLKLGQDRKEMFQLTVRRPDGKKVQLPKLTREGVARVGDILLEPGQTYTQRLLLNEWFDFLVPGRYEVEIRLATPIQTGDRMNAAVEVGESRLILEFSPKDASRLEQVGAALAKRINESGSYEEAAEAALTLSYIKDPIATPYLENAIRAGRMVESIAIEGLKRIANDEAVAVLISTMMSQGGDTAVLARSALSSIERNSTNPVLKAKIRRALS